MKRIISILIVILIVCLTGTLSAQQNEISKKIDEYIDAYIKMNQFSGAILISKNGHVLLSKGYGFSNHQFNIVNTPETKFRIGSLTKGFTALAIMQLIENNKLSLDDKLIKFIPDFTRGDEITIKHLLTMTSGIPDHTEFPDFDKERRFYHFTVSQTIETFKNMPLEFTPGEKFKYSNSNYILLGFIIEQISNITYAEYIEQNIFEPLKMDNSGFENPQDIIDSMAQGYCLRNNQIENAKFRVMSNAQASGALYSTTDDLYKWDRALSTNKLVGNKFLATMFSPFKDNYAFGWGVVDVFNRKMIAHSGEIDGFTANISRFPNEDICVVILSNFEHAPINRINKDLLAIIFDKDYQVPSVIETIKLSEHILQIYTGEYELKPGFVFSITLSNGNLYCKPTGQPNLLLLPISENEFIFPEVDAKISFLKDSNQIIQKLILNQSGNKISASKIK